MKILVIDDEAQIRSLIETRLMRNGHEVTQAEYVRIMGTNPSSFARGGLLAEGSGIDAARLSHLPPTGELPDWLI